MVNDDQTFPDTQIVDISESLDEDAVSAMLDRTVAGKYRILRRLARGGMGVVYVAEHMSLGRKVVIKVLSYHLADDARAKSRFEREARGLSVLDHPNVVTVHDFGIERGLTYIVMEFIDGENLSQRVRRKGRVPYEELLPIVLQTIDAIAAAHEQGIVHRDVKPSNVMVSSKAGVSDYVKVLDFGLAKLATHTVDITKGNLVGTVSYLSPEVIKGAEALPTADVYALGVMYYYLLAGTKPFQASDDMSVLYQHVNVDAQWLGELIPPGEAPHEFLEFVHLCMEKNPMKRPRDAMEMRQRLSEMVSLPSISAFSLDSSMALPRYAPPDSSAESLQRPRHITSPPLAAQGSRDHGYEVSQQSMTRPSIARARPKQSLRVIVIAFTSFSIGLAAIVLAVRDPEPAPVSGAGTATVQPVAQPAATTAQFVLTTTPEADVAVDGQIRGRSPIELELLPGTHVISVSRAGYKPWTQSIDLIAGQEREVDVFLQKVGSAVEARAAIEEKPPRERKPAVVTATKRVPKPGAPPVDLPTSATTSAGDAPTQTSGSVAAVKVEQAAPTPAEPATQDEVPTIGSKNERKELLSVDGDRSGLLPVDK